MKDPFRPSEIKITVIGGGTGSFTMLSALKKYTSQIAAIVSMADDGGSTGVLRDELGALPPGDVRQCLVALHASLAALSLNRIAFLCRSIHTNRIRLLMRLVGSSHPQTMLNQLWVSNVYFPQRITAPIHPCRTRVLR